MDLEKTLARLGKISLSDYEGSEHSLKHCQELVDQGIINQNDLNHALAVHFDMEVLHKILINLPKEFYKDIPYLLAKKHQALPIDKRFDTYIIAVFDPLNLDAIEEFRCILSSPVKAVWATKEIIFEGIDRAYHQEEGAANTLIANLKNNSKELDTSIDLNHQDLLDDREQAPIIKLLNAIIAEAIQMGASDIHFEPFENDLKIRYRIDGVLQKRHSPPKEYQAHLITRLKVMARLDIAEHRLPQDGRIKLKMGGREIDFRLSTVPVSGGERIVLRILDKGNVILGLDLIGMPKKILDDFRAFIGYPEGIVLVTGPTGSGKTTTLYSAISELQSDATNIMTIEDPIEYKLSGIAQIGVQPKIKLDFATGLRHILRQDPDVILIGEIRDSETAEIAIQAALTGHLVLSTLHTNDAPSAITRLVDMGIPSYLLSSSIVAVLAQRLVRTLCPFCKKSYVPSDVELETIGLTREELKGGELKMATGCSTCYNSGFKGRLGIYELMTMTSALKREIGQSADAHVLRAIATADGMPTLKESGKALIKEGVTTIAEILRVVK